MTSAALARPRGPRLEARAWLRSVGRPGPERWLWAVAAAGALVLGAASWGGVHADHAAEMPAHHAGMAMGTSEPAWLTELPVHLGLWVAMVAATMLPLIAWNLRVVGLRSPRRRRTRATLEVAAGWALVWLAGGVVLTLLTVPAMQPFPEPVLLTVVAAVAVGWQLTSFKRVATARCHRTFAPPLGRSASPACLRFGVTLGRDCFTSCWPLMALMGVAGHQLLVVAPLAWLSWRDRRRPHDRPGVGTAVAVIAGAGLVALLLGQA